MILFRRKCCEDRQQASDEPEDPAAAPVKKQRQADLSKAISQQWKSLSTEEKQYWEELAKEKKKEHEQMYPNYVYGLQWNKDKKATKEKSRNGGEDTDDENLLVPRARLVGPELAQPPAQLPPHPQPPPRTSRGLRANTATSIPGDPTAICLDAFVSHFAHPQSEDQRAVSGTHAQYPSAYGVRTPDDFRLRT